MDFKQTVRDAEDKVQWLSSGNESEASGFITAGNLAGWVTISLSRKGYAPFWYNVYQHFHSQQTPT
jgi:hypothetical protein